MGADVMRWLFSEQVPSQNIRFGYGPAREMKRRLLTLWNSASFFVTYANIDGLDAEYADAQPTGERPLDGWLVARTHALVAELDRGVRALLDTGGHTRVRELRRRSVELVHPPFAPALLGRRRCGVPDALVRARAGAPRDRAGDAVPGRAALADARRRALRARPSPCFLAGWPEAGHRTRMLLAEIAAVRRVVELGRQARARPASSSGSRCAGLRARRDARRAARRTRSRRSCASRRSRSARAPVARVQLKPNLPVLGPRLGNRSGAAGCAPGRRLRGARRRPVRVAGEVLGPDEVLRGERLAVEGLAIAEDDGVTRRARNVASTTS